MIGRSTPWPDGMLPDLVGRLVAAAGLFYFWVRVLSAYVGSGEVRLLLLLTAESLSLVLVLFARLSRHTDHGYKALVTTVAATFYFPLIELQHGIALVPESVGEGLQIAGICLQLLAKLSLGRSFGLLPANRGIVTWGPYGRVRHPMYLSYCISQVGFLLLCFSLFNAAVYAALFALQVCRIYYEEGLLLNDPCYRAYAARVRFRVIPGVF